MTYYFDRPESPFSVLPSKVLLSFFQAFVWVLWWLSIVEHVKAATVFLASRLHGKDENALLTSRSIAIDFYELFKWVLIVAFLISEHQAAWMILVTCYLLASNLFSHFYYHIWRDTPVEKVTHQQMQRRLVSFILAFSFAILAYAQMYYAIADHISWPDNAVSIANSLYLSTANTFTLTYGDAGPNGSLARALFVSQVVYAFVFVVMIIAKSLPNQN